MSPRRPVPARPTSRPGARTRAHSAGAQTKVGSPAGAGKAPVAGSAPDRAQQAEPTDSSGGEGLRIGGATGFSVPYHAVVLGLVLVFATIIVLPALRQYLEVRSQNDAMRRDLAQAQATAATVREEVSKWDDDAYVRSQARERLGYVMPGETSYVVLGAEDRDRDHQGQAPQSRQVGASQPWYVSLTDSVREVSQVQTPPATPPGRVPPPAQAPEGAP